MNLTDTLFVAGHRGMVGSAIVRRLQALGCTSILTAGRDALDLTDQHAVNAFFATHRIDQVYLAAAKVGGIHANNTYPAEFIHQNLMIEANIIHAAHTHGVQKLMFLAEAHANINDIAGCYQRYRYGPYDDAMVQEIELGLRQDGYYDTREGTGVDREKVAFTQMSRAGGHRDALAAALGGKTDSLRQLVDLFKGKDTAATEAVATLYAVWNDALIDGKQPDDAAIIRGFLQDWHPEKGKFKQADLQTWLGWMRRHGLVPKGNGPRTVSTNTPSLFERE